MSAKVKLDLPRPSAFSSLTAMKPKRRQKKNEELEKVRQEVLQLAESATGKDGSWHHDLDSQLAQLHAAWLCYKQGAHCLHTLCLFMTAVSSSQATDNWHAFAAELGLSHNQIMYISNKQASVTTDSTELVIRTYSQNKNSNLLKVIKSLDIIKRYDALQQLKSPLKQLVNEVKLLVENDKANYSDGKQSTEDCPLDSSSGGERLIAPRNYQKEIRLLLPKALQNQLMPERNTETVELTKHDDVTSAPFHMIQQEVLVGRQQSASHDNFSMTSPATPINNHLKINVFLTFAADGEAAARRIATAMRTACEDRPPFGVLILDENAEKILNNPEILINRLFYQVHYVVPILTLGYLKAVNSSLIDSDAQIEMRSAMDSLDVCYAQFVHNLMMNEYTENNCRNVRFRCIIPKVDSATQDQIMATMRKPGHLTPPLRAWTYEKYLQNFLRRLIGLNPQ